MKEEDKSKFSLSNRMSEVKNNTKSLKGNFKNASKASKYISEPVSRTVVFLVVFIVPIIFYLVISIALILILSGVVGFIVVLDDDLREGYSSGKTGSGVALDNNRDTSVPSSVVGKFLTPWNTEYITSSQGYRNVGGGASTNHLGMDMQPVPKISSEQSLALFPIYPGKVHRVNLGNTGLGNHIVIEHEVSGNKYYSLYGHLRYVKVSEGEQVGFKTHLGRMGCTGTSRGTFEGCGTHLHLEIHGSNYGSVKSSQSILKIGDLLSCGDNGETMADRAGNQAHCVEYRTEKIGEMPNVSGN